MSEFLISCVFIAPEQVFLYGPVEEHVLLEHHCHLVSEGLKVIFPDVCATYPDNSFRRVIKSGDQLHQRGFG